MSHSRLGLPSLYISIFLLSLTGLFAKLIPLDATSIIQLRSAVAAAGLALFITLQNRRFKLSRKRTYAGVYGLGILLGLVGTDVPMGIVPGGSANILATELGIPTELERACALAVWR